MGYMKWGVDSLLGIVACGAELTVVVGSALVSAARRRRLPPSPQSDESPMFISSFSPSLSLGRLGLKVMGPIRLALTGRASFGVFAQTVALLLHLAYILIVDRPSIALGKLASEPAELAGCRSSSSSSSRG